jgi:hypothetical protein
MTREFGLKDKSPLIACTSNLSRVMGNPQDRMVMLAMIMTLIIVTIMTLHLILKFLTTHRSDTHLPTLMVGEVGMVEAKEEEEEEEEEEEGDPPLNPEGKLLSLITIDSTHEGIACPMHLSHGTPHLVYWRQRRITALPCMSIYSY